MDKIACKTQLELKNGCFKHIFGILIKCSVQYSEKMLKDLVQSVRKVESKSELPKTQFERRVKHIIACKTHLE